MQIRKNRSLKVLFWVFWIVVIVLFMTIPEALRLYKKGDRADVEGVDPKFGVATVVVVKAEQAETDVLYSKDSDPYVQVRFNSALYVVREVHDVGKMDVGKQVRILYRVGKSGRVHVEYAEPLPTNATK